MTEIVNAPIEQDEERLMVKAKRFARKLARQNRKQKARERRQLTHSTKGKLYHYKRDAKPALPINHDREGLPFPPEELYDERLHQILSWRRPHDSQGEKAFYEYFLEPYSPTAISDCAWLIHVGDANDEAPPVMFSCHVDTVHWCDGGEQEIHYDPQTKEYFKKDGKALGADDGAGVWLLLEMIDAKVPGTYLFHRGEEQGGIGSSDIAARYPQLLECFQAAIAFDRRGTTDVITHQMGGRCCSDDFAQDLCDKLNASFLHFMYEPCDGGTFTDTANYTDVIPECCNVSVGYQSEHGGAETLFIPHLFDLREALIAIDWSTLVIKRDPSVRESRWDRFFDDPVKSDAPLGVGGYYGAFDYDEMQSVRGRAYTSSGGRLLTVNRDADGVVMDSDDDRYAEALERAWVKRREYERDAGGVDYERDFTELTRDEMLDQCYESPEEFVSQVRLALGLPNF